MNSPPRFRSKCGRSLLDVNARSVTEKAEVADRDMAAGLQAGQDGLIVGATGAQPDGPPLHPVAVDHEHRPDIAIALNGGNRHGHSDLSRRRIAGDPFRTVLKE